MGCYSPAWTLLEIEPRVSHLQLNYIPPFFFHFTLRHALAEPPKLSWNLFCSPSSLELVITLLQSHKQLQRQVWATRLNFFSQGIALPSSSSKNPLLPDVLEYSSLAHWTEGRNQLSTTTSLTSAGAETLS